CGPVCQIVLSVLVRERWRPTAPEQRLASHATVMPLHALKRSAYAIDLGEERLVLVDDRFVYELEERTHPCEVLKVLRNKERTSFEPQHAGPLLLMSAPGALVDLRSRIGSVHARPDDDRVERERTLLLRCLDFVNCVTHESRHGVEREGRLLNTHIRTWLC